MSVHTLFCCPKKLEGEGKRSAQAGDPFRLLSRGGESLLGLRNAWDLCSALSRQGLGRCGRMCRVVGASFSP